MKKAIVSICTLFCIYSCIAQEIVNIVLVGKDGVTSDIKKANSFIIVKKFPDGFQRLDYIMHAPLKKVKNYSDSTLSTLNGKYYEYTDAGTLSLMGEYADNQKNKTWYYLNDTGKVVLEEYYDKGMLTKTVNPDTVKKNVENKMDNDDDIEATYKNGKREWIKYLTKHINADVAINSVKGGEVRVRFMINTLGECIDVFLQRSVEFVLDEEALRVIRTSPTWNPAIQNGKPVNAYRIQPLKFVKQ